MEAHARTADDRLDKYFPHRRSIAERPFARDHVDARAPVPGLASLPHADATTVRLPTCSRSPIAWRSSPAAARASAARSPKRFAEAAVRVSCWSRGPSSSFATARESDRSRAAGRRSSLPCDLADRGALEHCAEALQRCFGAPDILVNGAGINMRKPMLELTTDDWDRTMQLNLDAPFFLSQRLAPAMIARGWGRIINIASLQSVRAFANSGAYGASKGGVMQLTRAQAEAWSARASMRTRSRPGFFATPLTAAVASDPVKWQANAARTFIGRNGELPDLVGHGDLSREPRLRLRDGANDLRRRRILGRMSAMSEAGEAQPSLAPKGRRRAIEGCRGVVVYAARASHRGSRGRLLLTAARLL